MRPLRVVALTILAVGVWASAAAQPTAASVELPELRVISPPQLQPSAAYLERLDRNKLASLMQLVGLQHAGAPIDVVLADEQSDLGRETPSWIAGFAHAESNTVVLFPSRSPSYPHDSMEALLHHEVAHVLIARAAGAQRVPRWFHEGLALAAERSWGFGDHRRVAMAAIARRSSVVTLDARFNEGPGPAAQAYAVSGAFVRDLLHRYGAGMPGRVLAGVAAGAAFETAFARATGTPLPEAERLFWRDSWWYQVIPFVTSSLAIWTGIMFLAVLAMRRRARHRAETRKRWEEEEAAALDAMETLPDAEEASPRA